MENQKILNQKYKVLLLVVFFQSCSSEVKITESANEPILKNNIVFYQTEYDSIYFTKNNYAIENWLNYSELSQIIDEINNNNLSALTDNKIYLKRFFKGIKNTIPEMIKEPEIISRITVIETDILKFESDLSESYIDEIQKLKMTKKVNNAFSNLNFQIDMLVEKQKNKQLDSIN